MNTQFFLGRHGETQWNVVKRLQGRLDSPMTDSGLAQAQRLAQQMAGNAIDVVVSSPLPRAHTTATICARDLECPMLTHPELTERHFGRWQGELFDSLKDAPYFESIFFEVTDHAPPQGESGSEAAARIANALQTLAKDHTGKVILVITHGDVLRCFLSTLRQKQFCDAYSQYGNGQCFAVTYDHSQEQFLID